MTDRPVAGAPATASRVAWTPVVIFVLLACALAWLVDLPLWLSGKGLRTPLATVFIGASMYTPAVAALVVVMVGERTPPRLLLQRLGWTPIRPWRRVLGFALLGVLGSLLLPVVTVFVAAGAGLVRLDLVHFSGFAQTLHDRLSAGTDLPMPVSVLVLLELAAVPVGVVINSLLTLGEETGWRGFLLPALRPLGTWPALVVTGVIWGLWHAPVILLGYNFNRPGLDGLALMVGGCVTYGILIGWLRVRTGTIWAGVLAHGALNAIGGFALIVSAAGHPVDLATVGPLGWVAWIVMALVIVVLVVTRQMPSARQWEPASVGGRP